MRKLLFVSLILLAFFIPGNAFSQGATGSATPSTPVELKKLSDHFWVHVTYKMMDKHRIPSNGLVVETNSGLVLIDTPWDDDQTEELLKQTRTQFKRDVVLAIITHAHQDRIGGIATLLKHGIEVKSMARVCEFAKKAGYPSPTPALATPHDRVTIGDITMEVFFPGEAHTADNITVWFPDQQLLFSGCLAKALNYETLGFIDEANLEQWPTAIKNLLARYPNIKTVIPGHGDPGDVSLLHHTLDLLEQFRKK